MPTIVMDLDGTLTIDDPERAYPDRQPNLPVIARLKTYRAQGFRVVISTARNMKTYSQSVGKINAFTLPVIVAWLDRHDVPYDEIYVGKPWAEAGGFYVDDRAIRPSEFLALSHDEIMTLTRAEGT